MATNQQTQANRANAQHSTGPRTATGKARSSQNALKHGLRAQATVLPDENPADFDFLVSELENQFQPQTAIEWTLLRQLADAEWRMRRVPSLEAGLFATLFKDSRRHYQYFPEQLPDDEDEANLILTGSATEKATGKTDPLSKLSRYESRLAHRYFKALEQLQKIQKARTREPKTPKPTQSRQTNPIAKTTQPTIPSQREAGTSTRGVNAHVCRLPNHREAAGGAAAGRSASHQSRPKGRKSRRSITLAAGHRLSKPTSQRLAKAANRPAPTPSAKPGCPSSALQPNTKPNAADLNQTAPRL